MNKAKDAQNLFQNQPIIIDWTEIRKLAVNERIGVYNVKGPAIFIRWIKCKHHEICSEHYRFDCKGKHEIRLPDGAVYTGCLRRVIEGISLLSVVYPKKSELILSDEDFEI